MIMSEFNMPHNAHRQGRTHRKARRSRTTHLYKETVIRADRRFLGYDKEDISDYIHIPKGIRPKRRIFDLYDSPCRVIENNWKSSKAKRQYEWHLG